MSSNFEIPKTPEVKFNKNGYEIRTQILEMAKDLALSEFNYKYNGWEMSQTKDEKTGEVINKVNFPEFPGLKQILDTAEQMYKFVNNK